jgi:hypothetical protein
MRRPFRYASSDIDVERPRRRMMLCLLALAALVATASFSSTAAADQPTVRHFDATFTAVLSECGFPVEVSSSAQLKETIFDQSGAISKLLFQGVGQDTFSANGKTLTGVPFHLNAMFVFDSSGNVERASGQGIVEMVRLPDGSLFTTAGRVDFVARNFPPFVLVPDVGATVNLAGFCAAPAPEQGPKGPSERAAPKASA